MQKGIRRRNKNKQQNAQKLAKKEHTQTEKES